MKANEFIKKFGWDYAKDMASRKKTSVGYLSVDYYELDRTKLRRLVASHELVELLGGIEVVKELLDLYSLRDSTILELKQAIADVESCQ